MAKAEYEAINPDNAHKLKPLYALGRGVVRQFHWIDNQHLLVATSREVLVYSIADISQPERIVSSYPHIWFVAVSHDHRVLAVACTLSTQSQDSLTNSHIVQLVDIESGLVTATMGEIPSLGRLFFSSQDRFVAAASNNQTFLWDTHTREYIATLPYEANSMIFDRNESRVVCETYINFKYKLKSFDLAANTHLEMGNHTFLPFRMSFTQSPSGVLGAVADREMGKVFRINFELKTAEVIMEFAKPPFAEQLGFSPDGTRLAVYDGDRKLLLFDTVTLKIVVVIEIPNGFLYTHSPLAFSQDGRFMAGFVWHTGIMIWELETGRVLQVISTHYRSFKSMTFSPDARYLAVQAGDLWVCDIEMGEFLGILGDHGTPVFGVQFANLANKCIVAHLNGLVRVWDLSKKQYQNLWTDKFHLAMSLACSPDERWVAAGGPAGLVTIWDMSTYEIATVLKGEPGPKNYVYALAFSADGQWMATGDCYDKIRLFRVGSFEEIQVWEHFSPQRLVFLEDNQLLVGVGNGYRDKEITKLVSKLAVWKIGEEAPLEVIEIEGVLNPYCTYQPSNERIVVFGSSGDPPPNQRRTHYLVLLDSTNFVILAQIRDSTIQESMYQGAFLLPDSHSLLCIAKNSLLLADFDQQQLVTLVSFPNPALGALNGTVNSAYTQLAVGFMDGMVELWGIPIH